MKKMNLYKKTDIPKHLEMYFEPAEVGLEETPEAFVEKMVEVFREVRRVLRNDGTLWLNLGDSFYNYRPGRGQKLQKQTVTNNNQDLPTSCPRRGNKLKGLKEKDLIGIPWRVAFALQADGWYLRQDIIWAKGNPMPESVRDRCTKSHEYIFLLSKSPKYYYDHEAIKEPAVFAGQDRGGSTNRYEQNSAGMDNKQYNTRNKRSVWKVNVVPYNGAHFATFPPKLIEPCVLAGCPKGGVVLDPFGGSGTTAQVAITHGRKYILCELNPDYIELAKKRIAETPKPLFA